MPEYQEYLAILTSDPTNAQALSALEKLVPALGSSEAQGALEATRESLRERGQHELVEKLLDVEINAAVDVARRADLLRKKGQLYVEDLLNEKDAVACFRRVLELRPDDEDAQEVLEHLDLLRANWKKVVAKYLDEARGSTDRQLTTALYLSAAETTARYERGAPEVEALLRRALEVDPANRRAATHLERLLRAGGKWTDLADLLQKRIDAAHSSDDKVHALVALADLAHSHLQRPELASACMKKVVALEPGNARALSLLSDEYQREQSWSALVMLYTNALKARRRGAGTEVEVGTLLQIAMLHWKRLGNMEAAEEFFRRIRKVDPAHQAALEFYREFLRERGDANQLVQVYRQAHKATPVSDPARRRQLSIAIAEISEFDLASPEKAIDAWKAILRAESDSPEAREALKRLYAKTEKWNGLLDLMKDDIERRPPGDVAGRVEGLLKVVEIYERMKLDVMAINTYNAILALDPGHRSALDALADKYKQRAQWSDLIAVLGRKAELARLGQRERVEILREVAALWIERFGNYGQAIRPLEQLLEVSPADAPAMASLKDIYNRRRQWRALISLLGREAGMQPLGERRRRLVEMAHLAAERLGDSRLAIEIWNRVLELATIEGAADAGRAETSQALAALASLYERDKRYLALADVYRRQRELAANRAEATAALERLGALYAERLHAPAQAADIYREILRGEKNHPRAARILRELYSASSDYEALERTYGELGQWEELVDAFHAIADRTEGRAAKLALYERAASVAGQHVANQERVARAWERVLAIEPRHAGAARALAPIYAKAGKSARLLATYEILLEHAENDDARLRLLGEIRSLCEDRLGSKALAFQWAARAYQLRPEDGRLIADLERLGAEADAWDEVAAILDGRVKAPEVGDAERLRLLRELGKISSVRLHLVDQAQAYWEEVLLLVPDDREALQALEEIATHRSDWPALLAIYRRRVELEPDRARQIDLLFRAAFLEEERLADLDAAVKTYRRIVEVDPGSRRAIRALSKLSEARGDWAGHADVLERELGLTAESDGKVALLLRLGSLYENNLGSPERALAAYRQALSLQPSTSIHRLIERFLGGDMPPEMRREVAALLLPAYEQADDAERMARAIEILRSAAPEPEKLEFDRRLVGLYQRLARNDLAYQAGLRVLEREPGRNDVREELVRLAQLTGALPDLADNLELLLADLEEKNGDLGVRRALAGDLAELCQDQLFDSSRAERAWRQVLELETGAELALSGLERIYRAEGRWSDLRALCQEELGHTLDNARRLELLFAIADLSETMLSDVDGAIGAYQRALEVDPSLMRAYGALERLYHGAGRWAELEDLLSREQEVTGGGEAQVTLLLRRARLRADRLGDRRGAVDLVEDVLGKSRGNVDARELLEELLTDPGQRLRVARILEPLYAEDGQWRDLTLALRAQREFAGSPAEAAETLARIAAVEEEKLSHEQAAFDTWREVLALGPSDERSRQHVIRLAGRLDGWRDALSALEHALEGCDAADLAARASILRDIAGLAEQKLRDRDRATDAYRRLLEVDPGGGGDTARQAAQSLDRLYGEAQRWPQLIEIVRRQADWAEGAGERLPLLMRLAKLEEERGGDVRAAIGTWREVLSEDADSGDALDALERLHQQEGELRELADILRRRVELASDAGHKRLQLERMARLYERDLGSTGDATRAWLEVLDFLPEDVGALDELARLYRTGERHGDLLEVIERRLAVAQPGERLALTFELGELLHRHLGKNPEALEHYADVLSHEPGHAQAIARVQSMLDDADLRLRAADVLLPLYERSGDYARLADLLVRVADTIGDPRARLRHLRRVAEIREKFLKDRPGALAAYKDAVVAAVSEPELGELLRELERVASDEGKLGDLIEVYQQLAPDVFDGDLQRRLYLDIADLARGVRHDSALARKYYQMVLDGQPDDRRALDAVEGIYRDAGENDKLYEVLVRKADLAGDDIEARADALSDAATLCQYQLDRPVDAMVAWEQVLELIPDSSRAAEALELLYQQSERWHDLTDLVERRLGFAFSVEDAVKLRFRLGQLCEKQLHDPDRAVENYSAALGGDPNHAGAREALERYLDDAGTRIHAADVLLPIYVARQDWPRLVRIYEIKLEAASVPEERMQLERYIARLHEDQLEDLEGAFRWYGRLLRENPGEPGLRSQLVRLAGVLDSWAALANLYEDLLDDSPGESPVTREVALALAELCERRLGEVERAHSAYRRVLMSTPDDADTFARLEAMLIRAQRWFALIETYEEAVAASAESGRRLDLYRRMAQVQEERLGDLARAVECHRSALEIDPDHAPALDDLERLFQLQKQWLELAELLIARIDRAPDARAQAGLRLRLADLLEERLADPQGAIDQYEKVLEAGLEPDRSRIETDPTALAALERLVVYEKHKQRISAVLEPIYRANDWWRKLVVILGAQLEYADEAPRRVAMLREIAELHESRGGDLGLALDALSRAWLEDTGDDEVFDMLVAAAARLEAWDQLVPILERGIAEDYDLDRVARTLRRIADIHEERRGDAPAAIAALRRLLESREDDPEALAALDRLLKAEGRSAELVEVVSRRAELAEDPALRRTLLERVATLQEQALDHPREAITAWRAVMALDDADARALDALERLYRAASEPRELAGILTRKIELAGSPVAARPLRFAAATVHERELGERFEAISHMRAVLEADPDDAEALAALDRLYQAEELWPDLLEVLDRRAALEKAGTEARTDLMHRAAMVVAEKLLESEAAIERLRAILAEVPRHSGARASLDEMTRDEETLLPAAAVLEELYRSEAANDRLADLYERRLSASVFDREQRAAQLAELAALHEKQRGDADEAFRVWARALRDSPEEESVQAELERLAQARGAWAELVDLYEAMLGDAANPDLEFLYASKLARIQEEALGDLERAAEHHRRALSSAADERATLDALARIYELSARYPELAEILSRQAEAWLDEAKQAEVLFRLGEVRQERLGEVEDAVHAYREVLERDPSHAPARAALERLLRDERVRADVVATLEPLYEADRDHRRLADLLTTKLSITPDSVDRASIHARVAELAENQLGDPMRALDAMGGWLAEDPGSETALAEVERLAESVGRWSEVSARLRGIVDSIESQAVKLPLLGKLGAVQLERENNLEEAERTFRAVLEIDPESGAALSSLERIYRERRDRASLADILWRRGELAFDAGEKRSCLAEVAQLREELGDAAGAASAWHAVLELDDGDKDALGRLAAIYEGQREWPKLIDVLEKSARFAGHAGEERAVRARIARLWAVERRDLDQAAHAWQAVLDLEPSDEEALVELEELHAKRGDPAAVQDVMLRRLDFADDPAKKVEVLERLARLAEQRGASDDAIQHLQQILALDHGNKRGFEELERLLEIAHRWHDLVELYRERADAQGARGELDAEVKTLVRSADVWETRLENPEAAAEVLEMILRRKPEFVPALTRLARIYGAAGEWDKSSEVLGKALKLGPKGTDAAELYVRLGDAARRRAEASGEDADESALGHFMEALRHDPNHVEAVAATEALARRREDWTTVAEMAEKRYAAARDPKDKLGLALELAELWNERLGQPARAVPLLEEVVKGRPDEPRARSLLADLYVAAGRGREAAPLYERLADDARKGRVMKDVARYRQRLGHLYQVAGDGDRALAAYEEAFRIDPTSVATMIGLGRLYVDRKEWEKARRVYRSLVLQNVETAVGMSKAEVYYWLGVIHIELGEKDKAKGMFQRALELEPNNPTVRQAISAL